MVLTFALTAFERLGLGLLALLFSLLALIVWLFPLIALSKLWRRMTRPKRQRSMGVMIIFMLLITIGMVVALPSTHYEIDGDLDSPIFSEVRRYGITGTLELRTTDRTFVPSMHQGPPIAPVIERSTHVSVIGMLALVPTILVLLWLARWLHREMPKMYRRPEHLCDECGYDMTGTRGPVCPECGETI